METEVKSNTHHENGAQIQESSVDSLEEDKVNEKEDIKKLSVKLVRSTRSRSRTPQKFKETKSEDNTKPKKEEKKEKKTASPAKNEEDGKKKEKKTVTKSEDVNGHSEKKPKRGENKEKKADKSPKKEDENSVEVKLDEIKEVIEVPSEPTEEVKETKKTPVKSPRKRDKQEESVKKTPNKTESDVVEAEKPSKTIETSKSEEDMDPLILVTDEPDPELQFDETSDIESGKGSPLLLRCKTRRSHTRNIPTPKTPKSIDNDSDKNSVSATPDILDSESTKPENLNDTNDSLDVQDISTRAEVGSDVTRLDYVAHNDSVHSEDQSYFNDIRERSIRNLSSRKSIHQGSDSYRLRSIRNSQIKSGDVFNNTGDYLVGMKRKRSPTPENRKKFKSGSPSLFSSPLRGWSSKFLSDGASSTPKLTGYKDQSKTIHEDIGPELGEDGEDKKNWCSIM